MPCACVDSRKYACDWPDCRKSYLHAENLASHRRQHTEPKPFTCDQCPLGYWQKSSLRSHRLKAHGPASTAAAAVTVVASEKVISSSELLAGGSSAGQLIDGIIKSVTASMQAAVNSDTTTLGPPTSQDVGQRVIDSQDVGQHVSDSADRLRPITTLVDMQDVGQRVSDSHDVGQHLSTRELDHEAGTWQNSTVESDHGGGGGGGGVGLGGVDVTAGVVEDSDASGHGEVPGTTRSSEPLNVYEFCEEETVNICRLKPSRTVAAAPRTSIELPQTTVELNEDDDDEAHDLMVFDDDMTPSVDRLAETVITYSRRKKHSTDHENTFTEQLPPHGKAATARKAIKRQSSAAGKRQKRTGAVELPEVCEEPVKKKIRRKRTVEHGDVDGDPGNHKSLSDAGNSLKPLTEGSNLSKPASGTRSTKRSKKEKITEGCEVVGEGNISQKSWSTDDTDSLKLKNLSSAAVTDGRRRGRKCTTLAKPHVDTSTECHQTDETAARRDDIDSHSIEQSASTAHVADHRRNIRRKVKGRKTRNTRQSSRIDVENEVRDNEDEELTPVEQFQSQVDNVELAVNDVEVVAGRSGEIVAGRLGDIVAGRSGEIVAGRSGDIVAGRSGEQAADDEHDVATAGPAAECLSDRTEILSVNDDDDDDDDDDGECTRRSSPASYKSEEHEPRVMVTAHQDHNEDSRGNHCVTTMLTLLCDVMRFVRMSCLISNVSLLVS